MRSVLLLLFSSTVFLSSGITAASAEEIRLSWPISCIPGIDCVGTHFRIGFPDVENTGLSYSCGKPGYTGHQGTDIVVSSIEQGVRALAADDGIVRWIKDGQYDRCPDDREPDCSEEKKSVLPTGSGTGATLGFNAGNFIAVEHTRGNSRYLTLYAHLGSGSLTVTPGQKIIRGQDLGAVASSGNSQIPHLHFGVYKADAGMYRPVDPWKGTCNTSSNGLWLAAAPYHTGDLLTAHPASTRGSNADIFIPSNDHSIPGDLSYW